MSGPLFDALMHSESRIHNKTIVLGFLARDGKRYDFEIAVSCVPLTIAALYSELGRFASLPPEERAIAQGIKTLGVAAAMKDDGTPTISLVMENMAAFQIEIPRSDLANFRGVLDELIQATDSRRQH
jgi:hypothetical protein